MSSKFFLIAAGVSCAFFASSAIAEPIELAPEQLDNVTAGVGANNVAFLPQPWGALAGNGFIPAHHDSADNGILVAQQNAQANGLPDLGCGFALCGVAVPRLP